MKRIFFTTLLTATLAGCSSSAGVTAVQRPIIEITKLETRRVWSGPAPDFYVSHSRLEARRRRAVSTCFYCRSRRGAKLTYMHDGGVKTLEEVIEFYDRGGNPNRNLDPEIRPLRLTAEEKKQLVAYLESLTGSPRS